MSELMQFHVFSQIIFSIVQECNCSVCYEVMYSACTINSYVM